ncbi:DUF4267 domain-containing protein [Nocardia sp. NPDC051030]|uniref:DUF4267 domain-containing protein n=1 Tax=Nocardia sp. NPDC051030 TaxID=3155162 RepID=UPI00341A3B19
MNTSRIATALSLAGAAFITYVGFRYLTDPAGMAPSFGMPAWPTGEAADFLNAKGVRDVVSGLIMLALLAARQRYALGIVTLVLALVPTGDMLTILRHSGSTATAFGVHGLTAALVAGTGLLLLRERKTAADSTALVSPATAR